MYGLDYETFAHVNLKTQGLDNYINDPEFRPLLASVAKRNDAGKIAVERIDFITKGGTTEHLKEAFSDVPSIAAHNASFERAVSRRLKLPFNPSDFIDTAVIARAVGAGERLESAAPQLLGVNKLADGTRLIQKFSMPQKNGHIYIDHIDEWTQNDWDDWTLFGHYCDLDATLSLMIAEQYGFIIPNREWLYELRTQQMNDIGWPVDLGLLRLMQDVRTANTERLEKDFRTNVLGGEDLNFNSTPQLRAWCRERGVVQQSFDELHVEQLIKKINKRIIQLAKAGSTIHKISQLQDVCYMLLVKQELGGSSLSKLDTIERLLGPGNRLRGQYLHIGAGQTWRTSGRGAQLQNLKKLGKQPDDMDDHDLVMRMDNGELSRNLRQVFTASKPGGELIVCDLSSVESRGLAFLADAQTKLDAYRAGKDIYVVQAASMLHIPYDYVTLEQRITGKVGELSCGYGAGAGAIARFAEKMRIEMSLDEADEVKRSWRNANTEIVEFWYALDRMLHAVVEGGQTYATIPAGPDGTWTVVIEQRPTPESLLDLMPTAKTITLELWDANSGSPMVSRWFQGCFMDGNDVCYHKASDRKEGRLWHDTWKKDGQTGRYKIYGGKLTGILVQSFCREIFFQGLNRLALDVNQIDNVQIIGQFHDEIVVEWRPETTPQDISLEGMEALMVQRMTQIPGLEGFPLAAVAHSDRRYIK